MSKQSIKPKKGTAPCPSPTGSRKRGRPSVNTRPAKQLPPPEEWDLPSKIKKSERETCVLYELARLKIQTNKTLSCIAECVERGIGFGSANHFTTFCWFSKEVTTVDGRTIVTPLIMREIRTTPWLNLSENQKEEISSALLATHEAERTFEASAMTLCEDALATDYFEVSPLPLFGKSNSRFGEFVERSESLRSAMGWNRDGMAYGFIGIDLTKTNSRITRELKVWIDQERKRLRISVQKATGTTGEDMALANLKRIVALRLTAFFRKSVSEAIHFFEKHSVTNELFSDERAWRRAIKEAKDLVVSVFPYTRDSDD